MNWFKKALFDSADSQGGEWLPAYGGPVKTRPLRNGNILEMKAYDSSNLFKAFLDEQYNNAASTWPDLFAGRQEGVEFVFRINGRAGVQEENKGLAFEVMSHVVQGIQESTSNKDFVFFSAYKEDYSGDSRESLYQAIGRRIASPGGFHQITTGNPESFLFVSSEIQAKMGKDYSPIEKNQEEDEEYEEGYEDSGFTEEDDSMLNELYPSEN